MQNNQRHTNIHTPFNVNVILKKLILITMRFQFLGNVLDYHISLSNPYPEDRNFNFELSDKKRFKSICVCCSPRPACSQSQPSFLTVVWKTFKLDATFVSDLHSGSEKRLSCTIYLAWCINPITWDYFLHLPSRALSLNRLLIPVMRGSMIPAKELQKKLMN